jgi:hypothetical protein
VPLALGGTFLAIRGFLWRCRYNPEEYCVAQCNSVGLIGAQCILARYFAQCTLAAYMVQCTSVWHIVQCILKKIAMCNSVGHIAQSTMAGYIAPCTLAACMVQHVQGPELGTSRNVP